MKQKIINYNKMISILSIIFVSVIFIMVIIFNLTKPRIIILHSYDPKYEWTRDINVGLKRVFKDHEYYSIRWHYMNAKSVHYNNRKELAAAHSAIQKWEPHIVIAIDDKAQTVAQKYINSPDINIVFAGVNGNNPPEIYQAANNVMGIVERKPIEAIRDVIMSIEALKDDRLTINEPTKIQYVIDGSTSLQKGLSYINVPEAWQPLQYQGIKRATTFQEWKKFILAINQSDTDYILVANYRKLKADNKDAFVPHKVVMQWTENHSTKPVIGINTFNFEDGAMLSIGASPYEQGEVAAKMAVQFIEGTKENRQVQNRHFSIAIRESLAIKRNIQLLPVYEAFARATDNYTSCSEEPLIEYKTTYCKDENNFLGN